jgi:hypothetical protein
MHEVASTVVWVSLTGVPSGAQKMKRLPQQLAGVFRIPRVKDRLRFHRGERPVHLHGVTEAINVQGDLRGLILIQNHL